MVCRMRGSRLWRTRGGKMLLVAELLCTRHQANYVSSYDCAKWSPTSNRKWCFQDLMLSRCTLHYTDEELIWECQEASDSDVCAPPYDFRNARQKHSFGDMVAQLREFRSTSCVDALHHWAGVVEAYGQAIRTASCLPHQLWQEASRSGVWAKSVRIYGSFRSFTSLDRRGLSLAVSRIGAIPSACLPGHGPVFRDMSQNSP